MADYTLDRIIDGMTRDDDDTQDEEDDGVCNGVENRATCPLDCGLN